MDGMKCKRCKDKRRILQKIKIDPKDFPEGGVILIDYFDDTMSKVLEEPLDTVRVTSECFGKDGFDGEGNLEFWTVCPDCVECKLEGAYKLFQP